VREELVGSEVFSPGLSSGFETGRPGEVLDANIGSFDIVELEKEISGVCVDTCCRSS